MRSTPFCFALVIVVAGTASAGAAATDAPIDATAQSKTTGPSTTAGASSHQSGNASFYSHRLRGRRTASGQPYDPEAMTAAHRTLPLGTKLEIVNPKNDRRVVVTVNDRGPVRTNRVLDVSSAAADALDMKKSGVTRVQTRVVRNAEASADSKVDDDATTSAKSASSARR